MTSPYQSATFGSIAHSISATHRTRSGSLIFLNTSDIDHGRILHRRYMPVEKMPGQAKKSVLPGDILFSEIRPANGRWALVREPSDDFIVSTKLMVIRAHPDLVVPEYLYIFLTSTQTTRWLQTLAESRSGTFPQITFDQVSALRVPLPSLEVQRAIAATIGALDDKIESNRRAVAILQTLIRTLFQKWRSNSPAEHVTTFGEFADIYGGATPKTGVADYWSGDIAWATPTDITALDAPYLHATTRTISESGLASMSAKLQPVGTILMTSRATIGAFAVNEVPTATNQGFIAVRPRHAVHRWFLLEEMRSRVPEMLDRANGSTFMELSRGSFKSMSIGIPSASAITELHALLDPLHSRSSQLDRECAKLAAARQAVLPELLSGRVHVGDVQG